MAGYTKNIAVIRAEKSGFSSDGGALSGLVKVEKYGLYFRAEVSLINFAPLTFGRYVVCIGDGVNFVAFEGQVFEGESDIDTGHGFAALVCFVGADVSPVASAVCGDFGWAKVSCLQYVQNTENLKKGPSAVNYEDEAIAEENYYEYGAALQGEGAVREDKEQKNGGGIREDEDAGGLFEGPSAEGEAAAVNGDAAQHSEEKTAAEVGADIRGDPAAGEAQPVPLAEDLRFYERVRGEIERLLTDHPHEEALERAVENSRWAKVNYGGRRFYVFGVIFEDGRPAYICYGVPAMGSPCPPSLHGMAGFIPVSEKKNDGYWVMYQDARTGASVKLDSV